MLAASELVWPVVGTGTAVAAVIVMVKSMCKKNAVDTGGRVPEGMINRQGWNEKLVPEDLDVVIIGSGCACSRQLRAKCATSSTDRRHGAPRHGRVDFRCNPGQGWTEGTGAGAALHRGRELPHLLGKGSAIPFLSAPYTTFGTESSKRAPGYEFDTGLHYLGGKLGQTGAFSPLRNLMNYVTDNGVEWEKMGDHYDVAVFGTGAAKE
eukprot:3016611-Rhodomonas_salina.1